MADPIRETSQQVARVLLVFVITLPSLALSQNSLLGENCDLRMVGGDKRDFLAFDREFRYALSNQDAALMALLVKTSLRVNSNRSTYYINDARSLQLRFQDIFTPSISETVLKEKPEAVSCMSSGVMYGDGDVWVGFTGHRYAIETVNIPQADQRLKPSDRTVEFVCNADKHRVIVDALGDGPPRYRAWTKPHALTEKPDLEILVGKRNFEGTGLCRYTTWIFENGGVTYSVEGEGGCYESSNPPPADSRGSLSVSVPGKPNVTSWCY